MFLPLFSGLRSSQSSNAGCDSKPQSLRISGVDSATSAGGIERVWSLNGFTHLRVRKNVGEREEGSAGARGVGQGETAGAKRVEGTWWGGGGSYDLQQKSDMV